MTEPELDALLTPRPSPNVDSGEAFLNLTAIALRRRVEIRRRVRTTLTTAILMILSFAAAWQLKPEPPPVVERLIQPVEVRVEVPASSPELAVFEVPKTAQEREIDAELTDDPVAAARLYRDAGDAFLREQADLSSAVRCYGIFLAHADAADRATAESDTWLLKQLKFAHRPTPISEVRDESAVP